MTDPFQIALGAIIVLIASWGAVVSGLFAVRLREPYAAVACGVFLLVAIYFAWRLLK